jgi:hypothetical protein
MIPLLLRADSPYIVKDFVFWYSSLRHADVYLTVVFPNGLNSRLAVEVVVMIG